MTRRTWALTHPDLGHPIRVTGFLNDQSARQHVKRHWCNQDECWDRLARKLNPRVFQKRLAAAERLVRSGSPGAAAKVEELWKKAVDAYEDAVACQTGRPDGLILALRVWHQDGEFGGPRQRRYAVVARVGFYAAWAARRGVSDLRTAMRPVRRVGGACGPPSVADFVAWARDYANRQVALHGTWRANEEWGGFRDE